jgi:hypothetical protein
MTREGLHIPIPNPEQSLSKKHPSPTSITPGYVKVEHRDRTPEQGDDDVYQ